MDDITLEPLRAETVAEAVQVDERGFSTVHGEGELPELWVNLEPERAVLARIDGEAVGFSRNYSLPITLPGGAIVPAAGVSWVAVQPTHRRRGVLSRMMRGLLDDGVARGEPLAILTASEGTIYERFGFGPATLVHDLVVPRHRARFRGDAPPGRVRWVDAPTARRLAAGVFETVRRERPGVVGRVDAWWDDLWWRRMPGARFDVVHERDDGVVDGYALYVVETSGPPWDSSRVLTVRDLLGTPDAEAALWRHVFAHDLVDEVRAPNQPPDTALPWLLDDSRAPRVVGRHDYLWVAPLDPIALLGARAYGTDGELVLEVLPTAQSHPNAAGRVAISSRDGVAEASATTRAPDLVLPVDVLGSLLLGGHRATSFGRAGRIEECTPGGLVRADHLFAADREPVALTFF